MNSKTPFTKKYIILLTLISMVFICNSLQAQTVVALDNWYNRETNAKTGKPFHYLWADTANSGYSRWGKIFTDKGAKIQTIEKPNYALLSKVNVYIIVDPDSTNDSPAPNYIMPKEADAIEKFVKHGGVLVLLANDSLNCEFVHLNRLSGRFGITFNHVCLHPVIKNNYEMGASVNLPEHPIFKDVKKIYLKEISTIKLVGVASKAILTENGNILMAECKYGKGLVIAIGDPWIYNEYIDHDRLPESFENRKAAVNLTDYILGNCRKK